MNGNLRATTDLIRLGLTLALAVSLAVKSGAGITSYSTMVAVKKWLKDGRSELGDVIWSDETTVKSPNTRRGSAYVDSNDRTLFQPGGISEMFQDCV